MEKTRNEAELFELYTGAEEITVSELARETCEWNVGTKWLKASFDLPPQIKVALDNFEAKKDYESGIDLSQKFTAELQRLQKRENNLKSEIQRLKKRENDLNQFILQLQAQLALEQATLAELKDEMRQSTLGSAFKKFRTKVNSSLNRFATELLVEEQQEIYDLTGEIISIEELKNTERISELIKSKQEETLRELQERRSRKKR